MLRTALLKRQKDQVTFGECQVAREAEVWIAPLLTFCCPATDSTFHGQPVPMKMKRLPPGFATLTASHSGNGYLTGSASQMKQGEQENTWNGESGGINSVIEATVSRGSAWGTGTTHSVRREWWWCYKAQDHCSVVAVWWSQLPNFYL